MADENKEKINKKTEITGEEQGKKEVPEKAVKKKKKKPAEAKSGETKKAGSEMIKKSASEEMKTADGGKAESRDAEAADGQKAENKETEPEARPKRAESEAADGGKKEKPDDKEPEAADGGKEEKPDDKETKASDDEETKAPDSEKAEKPDGEETKAPDSKATEADGEETKAPDSKATEADGEKEKPENETAPENREKTVPGGENGPVLSPEVPETPKKKLHIGRVIGRMILGAAVTLVAAGAGYYGYGAYYYANHYYSGTTAVIKSADGSQTCRTEDLSDLTVPEARNLLSSFTDDYVLTINSIKGTCDTISADAVGYAVTSDSLDSLETVMQEQDYPLWIIHMTDIAEASENKTIDIATSYDETELAGIIDSLECIAPDHVEAGQDAYLNYNEETYLYEVVDSVSGNQGDKDKITAKIEKAFNTNTDEIVLEDSDYAQPEILSDDPVLTAKRDEINNYLKSKITVSDNGSTIVVDGSVIINFLDIDEDWNVVLDQTKITNYVNQNFDAAFDTRGTTRTVNLKNSGEVTMSVGTFGDFVQTTAEVEKLVEEISAGATVEREPCYYNNYEVEGNGGIGDTYIDVNITQQKVYVVVNDETVLTTDCVTGLTNGTRDTPIGFYFVWWKTTNYTMTTYNSFVYYWMPIDETGVGLHDATWRSSFGGSIYKSNGSHGCINLPKDMAAKIYDIAYVGIPVVVHY